MSIASDLRAYADTAVNTAVSQGKQTISVAQAQLNGVADPAIEFMGDLREQAEKLVNVDALRTAIEPYVAQLKSYGDSVTDRVDELVETLKKDPRFGKVIEQADSFSAVVLELVQERVVKPVQSLTGVAARSSQPARKPSPKPAAKPSSGTATKPAATRPATRKPAAKTTARKAPAKRATTGTSGI